MAPNSSIEFQPVFMIINNHDLFAFDSMKSAYIKPNKGLRHR